MGDLASLKAREGRDCAVCLHGTTEVSSTLARSKQNNFKTFKTVNDLLAGWPILCPKKQPEDSHVIINGSQEGVKVEQEAMTLSDIIT
jgi:hypothetical protein